MEFSPDDKSLVVGTVAGHIYNYDLSDMENITKKKFSKAHTARITDIDFNKSGNLVVSSSLDGTVIIWNWEDLKINPIILDDFETWVWSVEFSPDNKVLLTGCSNGDLKFWYTHTNTLFDKLSPKVPNLLTKEEWDIYVSSQIQYDDVFKYLRK